MIITICGSMTSRLKMIEIQAALQSLGHEVLTPHLREKNKPNGHYDYSQKGEFIKMHCAKIDQSHAVLAVNEDKNGISNSIGGNTFSELMYAFVKEKEIYFLNPMPVMPYIQDELVALKPVILHGNLDIFKTK